MSNFAKSVKKFRDKTEKKIQYVVAGSISELHSNIIDDTPVLTGRAAANWQLEVDSQPITSIYGNASGEPTPFFVEQIKQRKIEAIIRLTKLTGKSIVYITNYVDYAYDLEFLHTSKKAPEGMVAINTAKWKQIVSEKVLSAKIIY